VHVLVAAREIGVARMLVERRSALERDLRQRAALDVAFEVARSGARAIRRSGAKRAK
jgi:hypothetical protein